MLLLETNQLQGGNSTFSLHVTQYLPLIIFFKQHAPLCFILYLCMTVWLLTINTQHFTGVHFPEVIY